MQYLVDENRQPPPQPAGDTHDDAWPFMALAVYLQWQRFMKTSAIDEAAIAYVHTGLGVTQVSPRGDCGGMASNPSITTATVPRPH